MTNQSRGNGMELTTPITKYQKHSQLDNSTSTDPANIAVTAPGRFRVIRRNGKVTAYNREKIAVAMTKAFLAVEGGNAAASSRIHETSQPVHPCRANRLSALSLDRRG